MSDFNKKCGPNASDEYDKPYQCGYYNNYYLHSSHKVTGTGVMNTNNAHGPGNYSESYYISSGITELGDECLSNSSITSIILPDTLVKIGNSCFTKSKITSITLPNSLEEIGHTNFPPSLRSITIPSKIKDFPTDNLQDCPQLSSIEVDKDNKTYRSIDGILYDYDVTEILLCPRAKSGKVIIPPTVKRIAEKCFKDCKKLTMIELPRSIEKIEEYAFSGLNLDRLVIPNTVKSIGIGCFARTVINKTFRFPQGITELPHFCFEKASIPSIDFIKGIEEIGDHCFDACAKLPEHLILSKVKHIGKYAFSSAERFKVIVFTATLSYIGDSAFNSTADDLKIICLSLVPFKLPYGVFNGISDSATLFIPKGTKVIYENTLPWSSFKNIEEFDIDKNFDDAEKEISDEHLYARLNSIANSIRNVDRIYLKEVLQDIMMSYQYVDNEDDYKTAIDLIKYSHRFNPVLITDMEKIICANWTNKYKLRLLSTCLFDTFSTSIASPIQESKIGMRQQEINELQLLEVNKYEISNTDQGLKESVEIHCSDILRFLQNEISLAERNIKIAVSWFTNYALFKQIKEFAKQGLDIQLIINNDSVNNGGYCLDFDELIELGVHISLVEYPHLLHHKFCIIDNKVVINGSYNWTRFSGKNYENIMIFRNNDYVTSRFNDEFEKLLKKAEHKDINAMPETVPQRPEYDRNAFKQYITEELDEEARETSDQREKIFAFHKAAKLNPEYFYMLNPKAKTTLLEAFEVAEQAIALTKDIAAMVKGEPIQSVGTQFLASTNQSTVTKSESTSNDVETQSIAQQVVTKEEKAVLDRIKVNALFMVLDVSGSMQSTYDAGHVYNITKKAVSVALAVSDTREVSLWEFGNSSRFIKDIGISNLTDIQNVKCQNSGTNLNSFITSADSSIKDTSLVIIFTDDDGDSIRSAVPGMKKRNDVFWQIIVYGSHNSITSAIDGSTNISLVSMTDYNSKSDSEITQALLKDYINWKKKIDE